jgi:hypothetical protein
VSSPRGPEPSDGLLAIADRQVGPIRLPEKHSVEFVKEFNHVYRSLGLRVSSNPAYVFPPANAPAAAVGILDVAPATDPSFHTQAIPQFGKSVVVEQMIRCLEETFNGSYHAAFVVDRQKHHGLIESLQQCSSSTASMVQNGTSIACHVRQICFSMEIAARTIRSDRFTVDWSWIWKQTTVDPLQWDELLVQLREAYRFLHASLLALDVSRGDCVASALQAMTQVAYHFGIVRQKLP